MADLAYIQAITAFILGGHRLPQQWSPENAYEEIEIPFQ